MAVIHPAERDMNKSNHKTFMCPVCEKSKSLREGRPADMIVGPVADLIRKAHPDWDSRHIICVDCLRRFRTEYIEDALEAQRGELTSTEAEVIESLREHELVARNVDSQYEAKLGFGERLADRVAGFGGSWRFIIMFGAILVLWIAVNTIILVKRPYDPYPFILLNLVLSCLAALQAPIIMMSQNRQEAKDRIRAEHDYQVNLKAEIEIRQLHIKLDQLMNHSWQRLLEIQQVQMDLMEDVAGLGKTHDHGA